MNFTMDTYAWIEYFEGSSEGEKVKRIIENGEHILFTPSIVLAELSDATIKGKIRLDWLELVKFITINTQIKEINHEIAREAGIIKNNLRKKFSDFGLIDAIVLATARSVNSKLLTGDIHLIDQEDVINMKKGGLGAAKGIGSFTKEDKRWIEGKHYDD